jgi:hypothetical protein
VVAHAYVNIKIEKYHGRSHIYKKQVWVSFKQIAAVVQKPNQGTNRQRGCNPLSGSFFVSFLEKQKRKSKKLRLLFPLAPSVPTQIIKSKRNHTGITGAVITTGA